MKTFSAGVVAFALVSAAFAALGAFAAQTPVELHGALCVAGNRVVDSHGKPVALSGASLFWSSTGYGQERMYDSRTIDYLAKDWNATLVRAAIGADESGGYIQDPKGNMARLETVVDAAVKDGIYVIIDWHSHHAERNPEAAVAFFTAVAARYGRLPNIIYELYNEPLNTVNWSTTVKPYAEKMIDTIRAIDPNNLIVVGSPNWSQDVDVAAANRITGRKNITYALHFYAGDHLAEVRRKAQTTLEAGISVFVSEWGSVNSNGDGPVAAEEAKRWLGFMKENCLSNAVFAVSDKLEGTSIFKPGVSLAGPITDRDLTPAGLFARDLVRHWSATCQ